MPWLNHSLQYDTFFEIDRSEKLGLEQLCRPYEAPKRIDRALLPRFAENGQHDLQVGAVQILRSSKRRREVLYHGTVTVLSDLAANLVHPFVWQCRRPRHELGHR